MSVGSSFAENKTSFKIALMLMIIVSILGCYASQAIRDSMMNNGSGAIVVHIPSWIQRPAEAADKMTDLTHRATAFVSNLAS